MANSDITISSDIMRGFNDILILSLLEKSDSYGYEISKKISELSDNLYLIKETTLYSVFTRLEKNDMIKSYEGNQTFGKRRMYYSITSQGKDYLIKKELEWTVVKKIIDNFIT